MKLDENIPQHAEWIARYLAGEMDDPERSAFEAEFLVEDTNRTLVKEMKKQWEALQSMKNEDRPDTSAAWNKLHRRLQDDNLIPAKAFSYRKNRLQVFLRIAASALILLAIGASFYFVFRKGSERPLLSIRTGNENGSLVKTLTDGSVIYLAGNTTFTYPGNFSAEVRNVELEGEAFFDIMHDEKKPFVIETSDALVYVLGTAFTVKTFNGNFELTVERGRVKVVSKDNPSRVSFVNAGEKVTAVRHQLLKTKVISDSSLRWYTRRLQFKDESLQNIIRVLNASYNMHFATTEKKVAERRLTVAFSGEPEASITEIMCVALNLQSQLKNDSIVLLQAGKRAR
jgi:ferric-dicitrate binding protein FerR (iron transport regulator)